jgi:hypothetical protein
MAHARYAPSSAARWLACPASAELSAGLPERSSSAADEGTRVHALIERAVETRALDHVSEDDASYGCVALVLDYVELLGRGTAFTEKKLRVSDDVWGTADVIHISDAAVTVVDYKNGAYDVGVVDNKQLLTYAAGVVAEGAAPDWFRLVVIQPNSRNAGEVEPVKQWVIPVNVVMEHDRAVREAVTRGKAGEPPQPGKHCRWCPAFGECSATKGALALIENAIQMAPDSIPDEAIANVARVLRGLGDFHKLVEVEIMRRLAEGRAVAGASIEKGRAFRRWRDETLAKKELHRAFGMDGLAPLSPTQAEGLGKEGREIAAMLSIKPPGKPRAAY